MTAVRNDGDWEGWLKFFLRGVYEVSLSATNTAREILLLREQHRQLFSEKISGAINAVRMLDFMYQNPVFSVNSVKKYLGCAYGTVATMVQELESLHIIHEITGRHRNRFFVYDDYMKLFEHHALRLPSEPGSVEPAAERAPSQK